MTSKKRKRAVWVVEYDVRDGKGWTPYSATALGKRNAVARARLQRSFGGPIKYRVRKYEAVDAE